MFLIERLVGISCYLLALLIVFIVIYYKKVRVKYALIFYTMILALFAYFYEPYKTADLFRIRSYMQMFSSYNLEHFVSVYLPNRSTPAAYLLYWLIGHTGNVRLLPALVALTVYSIIFYIIYKSAKLYALDDSNIAIMVFFVMSTGSYMMVISGIRTMLAISILCLCFFRESIMKSFKLWHIILYIVAALTHNLAIILIAIRCAAFILSGELKRVWKLLVVALMIAISVITLFKFEWLFDAVFEKAIGYITGDLYSYVWEYVVAVIALVIEWNVLRVSKKTDIQNLKENRTYLLVCVVTAALFFSTYSIFQRLITYIAPILSIPLLAHIFHALPKSKKFKKMIFVLSLIMLLVVCARGELCSLKFFVLS